MSSHCREPSHRCARRGPPLLVAVAVAAAALALSACGEGKDPAGPDVGAPDAAGAAADAGPVAVADAALPPDAGAAPDAAAEPDAGAPLSDAGQACGDHAECPPEHQCDQAVCLPCPPAEEPPCEEGFVHERPYGNGCLERTCCPFGSVLDEETRECRDVPELDLASCPWMFMTECWIRLIAPAAGQTVTTGTDLGPGQAGVLAIRNLGRAPMLLEEVSFEPGTSEDFSIASELPAEVAPDEVLVIQIAYSPQSDGQDQGWLVIKTNAEPGELRLPLIANTATTACTDADVKQACVTGQFCDETLGSLCQDCNLPHNPVCRGGAIFTYEPEGSNRCKDFRCECPEGSVYLGGCEPHKPCTMETEATDCAADELCIQACDYSPSCTEADQVGHCVPRDAGRCNADSFCAQGEFCNAGQTCEWCPPPEVPECDGGTVVDHPYGNGCTRSICCLSGTEHDPVAGTCYGVPMVDVIACPFSRAFACYVKLVADQAGQTVYSSADFGEPFLLAIRNIGLAPLHLSGWEMAPGTSPDFALITTLPAELQPDEPLILQFSYTPDVDGPDSGEFVLHTDAVNGGELRVGLLGNTFLAPCTTPNVKDDCVAGQFCGELGTCEECLNPVVPWCDNGATLGYEAEGTNRCLAFKCQCAEGEVYVPYEQCVPEAPCSLDTEAADCAATELCTPVCSYGPDCKPEEAVWRCAAADGRHCGADRHCQADQFCDVRQCEACPPVEVPDCPNGAIADHAFGNGCLRKVCCESGTSFDPATGTCVDARYLEVGTCPWLRVTECYLKLMSDEAGVTAATGATLSEPPVFSLHNFGRGTVHLSSIALRPGSSPDFSIVTSPLPAEIPGGESVVIQLAYTPQTDQADFGELEVVSDAENGAVLVVPVIGDTWWTPCSEATVKTDCIPGQYCEDSPPFATCAECPEPQDPMCDGGVRYAYEPEGSNLCVEFRCDCLGGEVYVTRQGCVAPRPCTVATQDVDCAAGETCQQTCSYFPGCAPEDLVWQCM